jgi:hypothetical protein
VGGNLDAPAVDDIRDERLPLDRLPEYATGHLMEPVQHTKDAVSIHEIEASRPTPILHPMRPQQHRTRLDEQAVSMPLHGPWSPKAYATRPLWYGAPTPAAQDGAHEMSDSV